MEERPSKNVSEQERHLSEKDAYEHVWRMFDKHAQQRFSVFNFFVVVFGGLILAYAAIINSVYIGWLSILLGLLTLSVVCIFTSLERRTNQLVKISEKPLKEFEKRLSSSSEISVNMLQAADDSSEQYEESYGRAFRYALGTAKCVAFFFLVSGAVSLIIQDASRV